MPDWFELAYGLNTSTDDSTLDPDGDGFTNIEEFQRRSDPFISDAIISTETQTETSFETQLVTGSSAITITSTETITTTNGFGVLLLVVSFGVIILWTKRRSRDP